MKRWRTVVLSFALAGCGGAGARGPQDPLDEPWLGDATVIRAEHLEKIAALGRGDPEVTALFGEATHELGGSLAAVAAHMSICSKHVQEGGLTRVEAYDVIEPRPLEDSAAGSGSASADARMRALKLPILAVRKSEDLEIVHYEIALQPKICFVKGLTVGEAYETVLHELVHALHDDPHEISRIAVAASDETAFLRGMVLAKGGEVAAYSFATRARLRVRGGHMLTALGQVLDVRSPAPIPPEVVADAILAPPPRGLGYATGLLRGKYVETLQSARQNFVEERGLYLKMRDERQQQVVYYAQRVDVDAQNLTVFEQNAEVGKARHDPALLAESTRQLAETKADIVHAKAMSNLATASIARLAARVADLDAKIAGLHGLP